MFISKKNNSTASTNCAQILFSVFKKNLKKFKKNSVIQLHLFGKLFCAKRKHMSTDPGSKTLGI
jgi:ribosomal protein L25 (general stress protein Ctc)